MEAIAIKTEPPEHVEATPRSSTTSAAVAAAETTKQPTTQNVAIEKSRCGEIFVTNNAKKWTFTCTYCDKTTRDIGEFICHIQFKHMNGQYNEDGGADNENELQPTTTLQNNAAEKPTNNQQPNILFQSLTQPIINEPQTQTYPVTPTIATVSSLANSNNVPFEYSDSTNESDDFNNAQQKPQHSKSLKITNPQSLNRSKRKHDNENDSKIIKKSNTTPENYEMYFIDYVNQGENSETIIIDDDEMVYNEYDDDDDDEEFIADDDSEYNKLLSIRDEPMFVNNPVGSSGSQQNMPIKNSGKPYCNICDRHFQNLQHYRNHMNKHTLKAPYKCPHCDKAFRSKQAQVYHIKTHTRGNEYQCPLCPVSYCTENQFITHMIVHESDTCFPCMVCGKLLISNDERDEHLKTHEQERPYSCDFCKRRFRQQNFLTNHLKKHCQYRCDFCPTDFHSTQVQRRPYACTQCENLPDIRQKIESQRAVALKNQTTESDVDTEDENEILPLYKSTESSNRIPCQYCSATFKNEYNQNYHLHKKHGVVKNYQD